MLPPQTSQILLGAAVALVYCGAVIAAGLLPLSVYLGRKRIADIRAWLGMPGLVWVGFVLGQGLLGSAWLGIALADALRPWLVWGVTICCLAIGSITVVLSRRELAAEMKEAWGKLLSLTTGRAWHLWLGAGALVVLVLRGLIVALPPENDDALRWYLPVAKAIAVAGGVAPQPFTIPHGALFPLQVEMHWAALFAIANESAVALWDYLCALSFLFGVALVGRALTRSWRVAVLAILMMLSTSTFFGLMGGGKVDNAAAQYGMAAFFLLILRPAIGRQATIVAGLCAGWAVAGRYTNIILLPALSVFAVLILSRWWRTECQADEPGIARGGRREIRTLAADGVVGGLAATVAIAPMLLKNVLLVGCPLAPLIGCNESVWSGAFSFSRNNISVSDLFLYPFIWTFAERPDTYGHVSPLFVGLVGFLIMYGRSVLARRAWIAGVAGVVSFATWLLVEPLILYPRFFLVPLGLVALPLSASMISGEADLRANRATGLVVRTALFMMLAFLLFQSRAVVHSVRYLASIETRISRYEGRPGYGEASWLNANWRRGQRVALGDAAIYPYFVNPEILWSSESPEEMQWLWERRGVLLPEEFWQFHAERGFDYVVVARHRVGDILSVWPRVPNLLAGVPSNKKFTIALEGPGNVIIRIDNR